MDNENLIDLDKFGDNLFDDFTKNLPSEPKQVNQQKSKIPVIILSGYLGSGKTTLLNYILKNSHGLKIGVIVNDFGKINVDNMLTSGNVTEKSIELSSGCVCCILGDNGLKEPLDILANETSQPDLILIEASGIAEPYDLMQTLRFSGNDFTEFGGNIYVVDALNFKESQKNHPQHFKKCLQTADIILLNKISETEPSYRDKLDEEIKNLNSRAPILKTDFAAIDIRILFNNVSKQDSNYDQLLNNSDLNNTHHSHDHHNHIHDHYQSVSFNEKKPLNPKAFVDFLDNLPENLFRAKGFCYFGLKGYEQKYLLQIVGKKIDLLALEWDEGETIESNLVLIGSGLNTDEINRQLRDLIDIEPNNIQADNMINFERFFLKN